jgi:hypothetical protein
MSTWKVESDWVGTIHGHLGTEEQRVRIELSSCSDTVGIYIDKRESPSDEVQSKDFGHCDIRAAREIADLLVLQLVNYCPLNGKAACRITYLEETLKFIEKNSNDLIIKHYARGALEKL